MQKSFKVFLACALGAFVGALSALQLGYFWIIGVLAGGLVGYLVYDIKEVILAVKNAWREVIGWRPDWEKIKRKIMNCRHFLLYMFIVMLSLSSHLSVFFITNTQYTYTISFLTVFVMGIIIGVRSVMIDNYKKENRFVISVSLPGIVFYWLPKGIAAFIPIICRFIKTVFLSIHSDSRLLCGIDAAIGAFVGFYFSNPILGAVIGGLLGVLNYEIMSKRVLKLVPVRS